MSNRETDATSAKWSRDHPGIILLTSHWLVWLGTVLTRRRIRALAAEIVDRRMAVQSDYQQKYRGYPRSAAPMSKRPARRSSPSPTATFFRTCT